MRHRLAATILAVGIAAVGTVAAAAPAHANYPSQPGTNRIYVYGQVSGCYQYLGPSVGWKLICV